MSFFFIKPALQSSHEILSQDCNLFRVRIRGHKHWFKIVASAYVLLMSVVLLGAWTLETIQMGLLGSFLLSCLYFFLSSRIQEERLLVIKGLGVQISSITAAGHERTTFLPLEQVSSVYIFESFDAFQTRHFFCIRSIQSKNFLVFENLKPSVDFLKRVLNHLNEIKR